MIKATATNFAFAVIKVLSCYYDCSLLQKVHVSTIKQSSLKRTYSICLEHWALHNYVICTTHHTIIPVEVME